MIEYTTSLSAGSVSVAVGDFNHDNRLDVVVANSLINNIGIFFGYGNGILTNQMKLSTGPLPGPYAVATADFNNDDRLDIAIANRDSHNIGILLGYGNGSFTPQMIFSTGYSRPISIAVGDFNNDKQLDIAIVGYRTDNISILFGYGDGKFGNITTYSTGYDSNSQTIAIGDFNNDTQLDIVVANSGTDSVSVIFGDKNGTFVSLSTYFLYYAYFEPQAVAVVDLNSDNRLDIVVTINFPCGLVVLYGYGNGSFAEEILYQINVGDILQAIAVGDLNNDFQQDVLVANYATGYISVLFSDGKGNFTNQTAYSTGYISQPCSIAIGDINNDKQLDIIVVNSGTDNVGVLLNYNNGSFANQISYYTSNSTSPISVKIGDFNNDHNFDIAFASPIDNSVNILFG